MKADIRVLRQLCEPDCLLHTLRNLFTALAAAAVRKVLQNASHVKFTFPGIVRTQPLPWVAHCLKRSAWVQAADPEFVDCGRFNKSLLAMLKRVSLILFCVVEVHGLRLEDIGRLTLEKVENLMMEEIGRGETKEEVAVLNVQNQQEVGGQAKTIEQVVSLGGTKKAIAEERKKKKKRHCRGKTKGTAFKVF